MSHFRNITNITVSKKSDADVRTDFFVPALAHYNALMGTSLEISDDTTSSTIADLAIAWLAASIGYSEEATTARDRRRGGLLVWEVWQQRAYEVMASADKSKFRYSEGTGMYFPRMYDDTLRNAVLRKDDTDEVTYGS